MPFEYIDYTKNPHPTAQGGQLSYGPKFQLSGPQQATLTGRLGSDQGLERLNQYNEKHATYVAAAKASGRNLSIQETEAEVSRKQATNASINHIIASGTGQNILNHNLVQFEQGATRVRANLATANNSADPVINSDARLNVLKGIAEQAAAVGRQQGYSRAILSERANEAIANDKFNRRIYGLTEPNTRAAINQKDRRFRGLEEPDKKIHPLDVGRARNTALRHTLTIFQGTDAETRSRAYRDLLKMSFDSPGNLRVGDSYGNNLASTGFDMPLKADGTPTARGSRLLHVHNTFAPNHLRYHEENPPPPGFIPEAMDINRFRPDYLREKNFFTTARNGNLVSSSQDFAPIAESKKRPLITLEHEERLISSIQDLTPDKKRKIQTPNAKSTRRSRKANMT